LKIDYRKVMSLSGSRQGLSLGLSFGLGLGLGLSLGLGFGLGLGLGLSLGVDFVHNEVFLHFLLKNKGVKTHVNRIFTRSCSQW
jgi:hypothetical protein